MNDQSFEEWAREQYAKLLSNLVITDETNEISPALVNRALANFTASYTWLVTIVEIETNKLNIITHAYEDWYHEQYNKAFRALREEASGAGRAPAQTTVEARITQMHKEEKSQRLSEVELQKSRVDLLKSFVKTLDKHATMINAISSNMRSELFFAGGVPMERGRALQLSSRSAHAHMADALGESGSSES